MNKNAKTKNNQRTHPQGVAAKPSSARDRVFKTAAELFYRKGIRAVGVEAIAAEANTTKMSLYRNFPSKDVLVAEWLRDHDTHFWQTWDAMAGKFPEDPVRQIRAAFALLTKHIADPNARGCAIANAAVELTDKDHPARKVIETHKANLRNRLARLCLQMKAQDPELLADELFLLMEGAQVSMQTLGRRGPARNVARAADNLIATHLRPAASETR